MLASKTEEGGHVPSKVGSLSKLERARKWIPPLEPPERNAALLDFCPVGPTSDF